MKKILTLLPLITIVVFAFFIRIIAINAIPATLNIDEASLGYNAFSIFKTGADEHGVFLPLALQSFGDWKLPVYSYIDALSVAILGISHLSVRLPSVLAGTVSVILIYYISLKLFKKKDIALLAAMFLAINPWNIFFSRGAYEVNIATTFFIGGFLLLLTFLEKKKYYYLLFGYILLGITMFTQHNYIIFSPLYVLVFFLLNHGGYIKNRKFILCTFVFLFIVYGAFYSFSRGGAKKTSNLNIFNNKAVIYNRADKLKGDNSGGIEIVEKTLYNKYSAGLYQLSQNYLSAFSSQVLFDKGGERLTHNIGEIGYFYVLDALLFLMGIFFMIWKKEKRPLMFILPWLILAPIPSALTTENTGTRLYTLVPAVILVTSYGFYSFVESVKGKNLRILSAVILSALIIISFIYFLNYYFVHFNTQRIRFWNYGYEEAVKISQKYPGYNVVMRGPENFPYIYFLLYNKYDPRKFRNEVVYYPETSEGFLYVKSFGKYSFQKTVNYDILKKNTIYFDDVNLSNNLPAITLPSGETIMKYTINKQ